MARIVPGGDCREIQLGNTIVSRNKDGAFHVPDHAAKQLAQAIGGFVAGVPFFSKDSHVEPLGPWCEHDVRPFFCDICEHGGEA
jgi:hypothetical protein